MTEKMSRFLAFKTIGTKIALICMISGFLLTFVTFFIIKNSMKQLVTQITENRLSADIEYLECVIGNCHEDEWHIENGMLYRGNIPIGDGTQEHANLSPFFKTKNDTGTDCYVFIRTNDEGLKMNEVTGNMQGHFLRVAGSTTDPHGNSIIGTYMDKITADQIEATPNGQYSGVSNIEGGILLARWHLLYNSKGENVGIITVGRRLEELDSHITSAQQHVMNMLIFVIVLAGIFILILTKKWTDGITSIEKYLSRISQGELPEDKLNIKTKDELALVANSINNMVTSLRTNRRIGDELKLASDIQANMLPSIFPAFPATKDFDIYATMTPAKEVGGDLYDLFMIDETHVAVVIGDVSGKGIPAALVMVIAKTLIKNHTTYGMEPCEVFTAVNKMLCEGNDNCMFVTAWMGILDTETGILKYVNAGHNPPLLKDADGKFEYLHAKPGFVLAGMESIRYRQFELQMNPGDRLFIYTDGVTEAENVQQELYGEQRLQNFLNEHVADSPKALLHNLKKNIDEFAGEAEQFDDMTMLILDYYEKHASKNQTEKSFPAKEEALNDANQFLEEELTKLDCPMKFIMHLSIALEEIFVNIAKYAYPNINGLVRITIIPNEGSIAIRFTDSGIPFNPLAEEDPIFDTPVEEREIGGLGIFLAKKLVDNAVYEYRDGQNILTLIKN